MLLNSKKPLAFQSGFTLIELMIAIAVIGILASLAIGSYQYQTRKAHLATIYQEINQFRMPYQLLVGEANGVTNFSPNGLNMPEQTKYCQFSVIAPKRSAITHHAVRCDIQNLSYLSSQYMSLDRNVDGDWSCQGSSGINAIYLPRTCR